MVVAASSALALDPLRHLEPVHVRHLEVEQDEAKGLAALARQRQRAQRRLAAVDDGGAHPPRGQDLVQDAPVRRVVVDDQHGHAAQVGASAAAAARRRGAAASRRAP